MLPSAWKLLHYSYTVVFMVAQSVSLVRTLKKLHLTKTTAEVQQQIWQKVTDTFQKLVASLVTVAVLYYTDIGD